MATTTRTSELLEELETIDRREDRILDALLQHGTRLEHHLDETERRERVVTVGDLRALTDALATVEAAIAEAQARIARASAAPPAGNGAVQHATFDALAASLRAQDAEADRLRALLRERLLALKEQAGDGVAGGHADPPAQDGGRPRTVPHHGSADARRRRASVPAPAQPPLQGVGRAQANRRERDLRPRDAEGRTAGGVRPRHRGGGLRAWDHPRGAQRHPHAEPPHTTAARARAAAPRLGAQARRAPRDDDGRTRQAPWRPPFAPAGAATRR